MTAYRGLMKIENDDAKELLKPSPEECLDQIEQIVPAYAQKKTTEMKRWLYEALQALGKPTSSVDEFV